MATEPTPAQKEAAEKAKKILLALCFAAAIAVALSFTRTGLDLAEKWLDRAVRAEKDVFNEIPFSRGFWINPSMKALSGGGMQKVFSQLILFRPSLEEDITVSSMEFDITMTTISYKFVVTSAYDEYLVVCFGAEKDRGLGFRISVNRSIPSGWVRYEGNRFTLLQSEPLSVVEGRPVRIAMTFDGKSTTVKVGERSFSRAGDESHGAVGFFLGFLNTRMENLVIHHSDGHYRDLLPREPTPLAAKIIIIVLFFLLPLANWIGYSWLVHRALGADFTGIALRDFPLVFLFLFFKVNPHATLAYGAVFFIVLMATIRGLVLASAVGRSGRSASSRLKTLAVLAGTTAITAIAVIMLSLAFTHTLKPGEAFMNRPLPAAILFVILYGAAAGAFLFPERTNQPLRIALTGAFFVLFSYIPAYWSPKSLFTMSDMLFKPRAMYHDYRDMAKMKKISDVHPGQRRIYILGGSAAYGFPMGVSGKAFSRYMEGNLRSMEIRADVFNLGMMGHTISTLRYSMKRNRIFELYPVDMVILYLGYNGATYYPRIYGMPEKTDWQSIRYINDAPLRDKAGRIIAFSRPVMYLGLLKSMFTEPAVSREKAETFIDVDRGVVVPRVDPREIREHLTWFKEQCDRKKAKLVVVPVLINRLKALSELSSQNAQVRALVDEANRLGVPVIDLYPDFDSVNNHYLFDPVHLTPEGHRRVGELLAPRVAPYLR